MCSQEEPECNLAAGGVLTGVWSVAGIGTSAEPESPAFASISFPVRVSPAPTAIGEVALFGGLAVVGYQMEDGTAKLWGPYATANEIAEQLDPLSAAEEAEEALDEVCPGNADEPKAKAGFLCVYTDEASNVLAGPGAKYVSKSEAAHSFGINIPWAVGRKNASEAVLAGYARGAWAVTG
jgi:hypothetical protein